jgi:hypothetical protein
MSSSSKPALDAPALFLLLLAACLSPSPATAGRWNEIGPAGVTVTALAVDRTTPSVLYAGTADGGLFRSADGGNHWVPKSPAGASQVLKLVVDSSGAVYAYVLDSVFRSADGGDKWTAVTDATRSTLIDPNTPGTLYRNVDNSILRTTNGGATWSGFIVRPNCSSVEPFCMASLSVTTEVPTTLYEYGSQHAGKTQIPYMRRHQVGAASVSMTGAPFFTVRVLSDSASPNALYATDAFYGLYKSTNRIAWEKVAAAPKLETLAIDPAGNTVFGTLGVDVLRSTDGGTTWLGGRVRDSEDAVTAVIVAPTTPSATVYAISGGRLFAAIDPPQPSAVQDQTYTPVTPCRFVDGINASDRVTTAPNATTSRWYRVRGTVSSDFVSQGAAGSAPNGCGIPLSATAVVVNLTVADPTSDGDLKADPSHLAPSNTSTLNFTFGGARGKNLANAAIVPLCDLRESTCASGSTPSAPTRDILVTFHAGASEVGTFFLADVVGYFGPAPLSNLATMRCGTGAKFVALAPAQCPAGASLGIPDCGQVAVGAFCSYTSGC